MIKKEKENDIIKELRNYVHNLLKMNAKRTLHYILKYNFHSLNKTRFILTKRKINFTVAFTVKKISLSLSLSFLSCPFFLFYVNISINNYNHSDLQIVHTLDILLIQFEKKRNEKTVE